MLTRPDGSESGGFSCNLRARRRRHKRKARAAVARRAMGMPAPRPITRPWLLLFGAVTGIAEGARVEVMTEKIVVTMPAELEVTADVVMVVGGGLEVDEVDVEVVLVVPRRVDDATELEEVDEPVMEVGGTVLEMKAIVLAELKSSMTALRLSQQFFLGSRLLSQHHESSGQCCIASLPAAVLSAPHQRYSNA